MRQQASTITMRQLLLFQGFFGRGRTSRVERTTCWCSDDATLRSRWRRIAEIYFPERADLREYEVIWSARSQRRVLGSCNLDRRRVRIARALDRPELGHHLDALLYHEMCHAVVGMKAGKRGRRIFHGKEFREIERRHPGSIPLDLWIRTGGWRTAVRSYASHRGSAAKGKRISQAISR